MQTRLVHILPLSLFLIANLDAQSLPGPGKETLGNHPVIRDAHGTLMPWTSWKDALAREMRWYAACPAEHGYPRFVWMTFMDGNYQADPNRSDFIPATQNGMGILSYIKYYSFTGRTDKQLLAAARLMGDYLINECNTPDTGRYPRFTRSTGVRGKFPQPPDCGTQGDRPYEIQPDKGGIAGYALLMLSRETYVPAYFDQALHNARVLAATIVPGDSVRSPWPYRADYRTGEPRGSVSANTVYILRLFDALIADGYAEFSAPRAHLWAWIRDYQLPNLTAGGMLWVQFFEDHHGTDNRNAWAPLNLARYLLERREQIDPEWRRHARECIDFVNRNFTSIRNGVTVCGEQDYDRNPWGGILSTYGAVLAMYCAATGSEEFKGLAWQALNYTLYAIDDDGCPGEQSAYRCRGGWQEDAHTDVIHNFVDAMTAIPEWGR